MELDKCLLARLVEHAEGVDAEPGHEAVRLGDADIVQQEGELRGVERARNVDVGSDSGG